MGLPCPVLIRFTSYFPDDRKKKAHVPTQEGITADVSVVYKCALPMQSILPPLCKGRWQPKADGRVVVFNP